MILFSLDGVSVCRLIVHSREGGNRVLVAFSLRGSNVCLPLNWYLILLL